MSGRQTRIGFTGTQIGMTHEQRYVFKGLIHELKPTEFHHGDCIGADKQAHELIREISPQTFIIGHPPKIDSKRARCKCDMYRMVNDYLQRNQNIVNECEIIIATPKEKEEQLRSGTWSTIRRAKKGWRKLYIINPDGSIQ